MSSSKMGHELVTTASAFTVSTSGSSMATALMHRMSKPYTSSQKLIFSSL